MLVIIGLLAGGVMVGQDLVRQAELRTIMVEYDQFRTAFNAFRSKYSALPGDMRNATSYWQVDSSAAVCTSNGSAGSSVNGVCDGDGDGRVECGPNTLNAGSENFQFWRQLQLAGLIQGMFTGKTVAADCNAHVLNTNTPTARINNAGWGVETNAASAVNATNRNFTLPGGLPFNLLVFGATLSAATPVGGILNPGEAFSIDTKIDDGKPGQGSVIARSSSFFGSGSCTNAADTNDLNADYALTVQTPQCAFIFLKFF